MKTKMKDKTELLKSSPLSVKVGRYTFYFSTVENYNLFKDHHKEEITGFNTRLNNSYQNAYNMIYDEFALIRFYNKTEKYGFYLEIDGVGCECLEKIQFESRVRIVS